jgi:chromosome segregation ATPase
MSSNEQVYSPILVNKVIGFDSIEGIGIQETPDSQMDQEVLKTNLNGLERKLLVLINEHKTLKEEIKTLRSENQELRAAIRIRDEQIAGFHNQLKITKIVDNLHPEDGSVSELKKKVDEYIREIDKCIAHLSR